jgi:hypothetical protein
MKYRSIQYGLAEKKHDRHCPENLPKVLRIPSVSQFPYHIFPDKNLLSTHAARLMPGAGVGIKVIANQ